MLLELIHVNYVWAASNPDTELPIRVFRGHSHGHNSFKQYLVDSVFVYLIREYGVVTSLKAYFGIIELFQSLVIRVAIVLHLRLSELIKRFLETGFAECMTATQDIRLEIIAIELISADRTHPSIS